MRSGVEFDQLPSSEGKVTKNLSLQQKPDRWGKPEPVSFVHTNTKQLLTQSHLKKLLKYNPETGLFTWRVYRSQLAKKRQIAGSINKDGYRRITIDGQSHTASRLAWLYMEGYLPEHDIDHINRDRDDNRWKNLRHVSRSCNLKNKKVSICNKSGVTGVCKNPVTGKWRAALMVNGVRLSLGHHDTKIKAVEARWSAEKKHNIITCNPQSSAYQYLEKMGVI